MKPIMMYLMCVLSAVFAGLLNDGLMKLVKVASTGLIFYKLIASSFVGVIVALIFYSIMTRNRNDDI